MMTGLKRPPAKVYRTSVEADEHPRADASTDLMASLVSRSERSGKTTCLAQRYVGNYGKRGSGDRCGY